MTTTTKFRRKAVSGEEAAYSNVVTVSVREPIAEYLSFRPIAGVVSEEDRDMRTAGLKTYEKIGILGADTDVGKFIERAFYYDYRGRIIQIVETNHLGGLSYYSTEYDFVGNILKSHELHTSDMQSASPANTADRSGSHRKLTEFTYDHRGRLLTEKTTLDDNEPVTVSYAYDPLGELRSKRMGADLLVETYEYNLQGWRTNHTVSAGADTLFETKLHYYEPRFEGTTPTYTGNISEWEWQHGTDAETNAYAFAYDRAARLVETKQYIDGVGSDGFVEKGITYDSNGNIQTLSRTAAGSETENYRYTYAGNRMTQLHDSTTGASHSFAYDANGNMIRDGANNLDMTYNSTDLLKNVEQGGAILAKYSYLADGRKLTATESAGNGLCYLGSLVYRTQNGTFDLESASFGGGRLVVSSEGLETRYFLTDHLGSVRQVVAADGSVIEQNDYYPFGKRWAAVAAPISDNRHRFSGKEEQAFLSLPYVDFGARMYNPDWGRWFTQDPLLEKYYPIGQYVYCAGNPINQIDFDGNLIIFINGFTANKAQQGTAAYWRKTYKTYSVDFASSVQAQLDDNNVMYRHGGTGLKVETRMLQGELQAVEDYDIILQAVLGIDGIPKETIKIITHSMGAAFGKGYVKKLKELLAKYGHSDILISLVADFDPYQASQLSADPNIHTLQFTHKGIIADQRQKNLPDDNYREDSKQDRHSIYSFFNDISQLQEGTYVYDGHNWILQN
ncbi:MAG: RHS repeat domain-containing protein [Alistipes sp.]